MISPHLDHVELGDAVLLHTHGHGDAVLFDEHCDTLVVRKGDQVGQGEER